MAKEEKQQERVPVTVYLSPDHIKKLDSKRLPLLKTKAAYIRDLIIQDLLQ